jgi:hypothetical protein
MVQAVTFSRTLDNYYELKWLIGPEDSMASNIVNFILCPCFHYSYVFFNLSVVTLFHLCVFVLLKKTTVSWMLFTAYDTLKKTKQWNAYSFSISEKRNPELHQFSKQLTCVVSPKRIKIFQMGLACVDGEHFMFIAETNSIQGNCLLLEQAIRMTYPCE